MNGQSPSSQPPRDSLFHNRYKAHARRYLEKCRRIQAALDEGKLIQLDWAGPVLDRDGWRREFRALLDRRINLKADLPPWRKLSERYQTGLQHDQCTLYAIVNRRLRWYRFETLELNKRFAHLLVSWDEYRGIE
jgi:hypothetical protein